MTFFFELRNFAEDALLPFVVASKTRRHTAKTSNRHGSRVDGIEDFRRSGTPSPPWQCHEILLDGLVEAYRILKLSYRLAVLPGFAQLVIGNGRKVVMKYTVDTLRHVVSVRLNRQRCERT